MEFKSYILQICRFALAFFWFYQGLVPKLLNSHADEIAITNSLPWLPLSAPTMVIVFGCLEVVFGILVFLFYKKTVVYKLSILAMLMFLVMVVAFNGQFSISAFNVVTSNMMVIAICMIAKGCLKTEQEEWTFIEK